jgi:ABC-2 type transport system permease protein
MVPATIATGLVASVVDGRYLSMGLGFGVAVAAGGTAYALVFMAASLFTSRALAIGLAYVLVWEGILSGLLEGTRAFSIRQAALGLASALTGWSASQPPMDPVAAGFVLAGAIVGATAIATWRLSRFQLRGGD